MDSDYFLIARISKKMKEFCGFLQIQYSAKIFIRSFTVEKKNEEVESFEFPHFEISKFRDNCTSGKMGSSGDWTENFLEKYKS